MKVIEELLDLLLPTRCALCSTLGSPICTDCARNVDFQPRVVTRGDLVGRAVTSFGAREQLLIHAFKENGQTSLAGFLTQPLTGPLHQIIGTSNAHLLVPVPSSIENYKKRGFKPTKILSKRVAKAFGQGCESVDCLSFTRKVQDQAQLDSESRKANLVGSMSADSRVEGRQILLFDDVVTTGSTILEAARAATLAGAKVVGFLAFAETILKTPSKY